MKRTVVFVLSLILAAPVVFAQAGQAATQNNEAASSAATTTDLPATQKDVEVLQKRIRDLKRQQDVELQSQRFSSAVLGEQLRKAQESLDALQMKIGENNANELMAKSEKDGKDLQTKSMEVWAAIIILIVGLILFVRRKKNTNGNETLPIEASGLKKIRVFRLIDQPLPNPSKDEIELFAKTYSLEVVEFKLDLPNQGVAYRCQAKLRAGMDPLVFFPFNNTPPVTWEKRKAIARQLFERYELTSTESIQQSA